MITRVTLYRTNDGTLHRSREDAVAIVEAEIQAELNEILKGLGLSSHRDLVAVVTALAGSIEKAMKARAIFNRWLDGIDEDNEREEIV